MLLSKMIFGNTGRASISPACWFAYAHPLKRVAQRKYKQAGNAKAAAVLTMITNILLPVVKRISVAPKKIIEAVNVPMDAVEAYGDRIQPEQSAASEKEEQAA